MKTSLFRLVLALKRKCLTVETIIQQTHSLNQAEFNSLMAVDSNESLCGGIFAERIGLSHSRASRVATRLMKRGLFLLKTNSSDRREVLIRLSAKGIVLKKAIEMDLFACEKKILDKFSVDEQTKFSSVLQSLVDGL